MTNKTATQLPSVYKSDVEVLPKTDAVLLRHSKSDKITITSAASKLHLTVTEFNTKSALLVAGKIE